MILENIARDLGVGIDYLNDLVRAADHHYKSYTIPKRSGGSQLIQHPS